MSLLFTLKGVSSTLSSDFIPPIELDPEYKYGLALIGFYSYNTIPNIKKNSFYFKTNTGEEKQITIPTGTYEITDIEKFLKESLETKEEQNSKEKIFFLRPNNSTLQCEIFHKNYHIDFTKENTIAHLLGFSKKILTPGEIHRSDLPVRIIDVRTIQIDSNITDGSFYNGKNSHNLYEFAIGVDPGYAIDETPRNLIYLPVTTRKIHNITLNILDQDFLPVNFRGEEIIIRLELKRWS